MKKLIIGVASLSLLLTACGETVSNPNVNIPTKDPVSSTTKVLFQDPVNRYALLTTTNCPLVANIKPKSANEDALLPNEKVVVGTANYTDWFSYAVMNKANYDQYVKKYADTQAMPSNEWQLNDQSHLITFAPQEGPSDDTIKDCTVSVQVK